MQQDRTTHRGMLRRIIAIMSCLLVIIAVSIFLSDLGFPNRLPQEHPDGLTYQEVQEAIEELTIQPVLPTWYPKGTVLEKMVITDLIDSTNINIAFTMNGMEFNLVVQVFHSVPIGTTNYEKNPGPIEIYYVEQIPHYIIPNMSHTYAVWKNGNTENMLYGPALNAENIKKMIDSIYR